MNLPRRRFLHLAATVSPSRQIFPRSSVALAPLPITLATRVIFVRLLAPEPFGLAVLRLSKKDRLAMEKAIMMAWLKFRICLQASLLALSVALGASLCESGEIAASISFEDSTRPAGLPDDMQPLPGASLRFLSIKAIDGFNIEAALWQPNGKPPAETTIIVQVHGSGGNLAEFPLRAIARALSPQGYAALAIDTRQHDAHLNTDNFFDVRRDIEAAVATARALGYNSIVLQGHSLGTVQVEFYAATNWDPSIKAVVLTGPFGRLPWKTRNIIIQEETIYKMLREAAQRTQGGQV
jgi:alpha/beta hydrolase fold